MRVCTYGVSVYTLIWYECIHCDNVELMVEYKHLATTFMLDLLFMSKKDVNKIKRAPSMRLSDEQIPADGENDEDWGSIKSRTTVMLDLPVGTHNMFKYLKGLFCMPVLKYLEVFRSLLTCVSYCRVVGAGRYAAIEFAGG